MKEEAMAPVVQVKAEVAKVSGVITTKRWKAEVVNVEALIKFVAKNPKWAHLLKPDTAALNALARSQKAAMEIPGVLAVSEESKSVRTSLGGIS